MKWKQTYLGLIGYAFIGTAAVLMPSVMPSITDEFAAAGLTLAAIGLIFPARSLGSMAGNVAAGIGSDLIGRQRLVWLSALVLAATLALTAAAKLWVLFVLGFVLVSAAQSSLSTGINALVADANREARSRALNILHGIYGAGAAVSPLIIGALITRGLAWRWALAGTGLIWLVYGLVMMVARSPATEAAEKQAARLELGMLRDGAVLALFMVAFIYNGVAYSLLNWTPVFMQREAGFSTFWSVATISVFYVGLTIGRFLCAAFSERLGYAATLLGLGVGVMLTYPLVVLDLSPALAVVGIFGTGLGLSGLFPTALAYGARLYPAQTGTVTGTLNVAMTLGAMVPPLWTPVIAERWSFQVALGVNYLLVVALVFLAIYLGRRRAVPRLAAPPAAEVAP